MVLRASLIFCLIFLTLYGTQGVILSKITRCSCIDVYNQPVNPRSLEKLEMIPAGFACPNVEIIATMKKTKEKRCLNPESENVKKILEAISKKR
ncbi:PREDICTED: c-X-C motif chemokine 10 [Chrysochloris asiatica]|uniref:C-X-C motif chemokine n=1 Tax=Chrysochloris asiatica TaxID=185453 RepID=A0A9B0WXK5_CHRAS|nr:PREDICTED: c-X-C motif chemokine 10 [Chrysochloris asiatica]